MGWQSVKKFLPFLRQRNSQSDIDVRVDQERCRGCSLCAKLAPEVFQMNDEGKAQVVSAEPVMTNELLLKIISACPACAIRRK